MFTLSAVNEGELIVLPHKFMEKEKAFAVAMHLAMKYTSVDVLFNNSVIKTFSKVGDINVE